MYKFINIDAIESLAFSAADGNLAWIRSEDTNKIPKLRFFADHGTKRLIELTIKDCKMGKKYYFDKEEIYRDIARSINNIKVYRDGFLKPLLVVSYKPDLSFQNSTFVTVGFPPILVKS